MTIHLMESHFGSDDACIGFPNLLLCMGLVVMTGSKMYGVHIDSAAHTADIMTHGFKPWLTGLGVASTDMKALYGSCNWSTRWGKGGDEAKWKAEMQQIAAILGYKGSIRGFNTGTLVSKDIKSTSKQYGTQKTSGMYVEYHLIFGQDKCKILYKKNWKMDVAETATHISKSTNVVEFDFFTNTLKTGNKNFRDVTKAELSAKSESGHLNEVRHDLKEFSFNI